METFAPGDRVVAIDTDHSGPICPPPHPERHSFHFPNGHLQPGVVYHVKLVTPGPGGNQGLRLTGLPVFWGPHEIPWCSRRFRKLSDARGHASRVARHRRRQRHLAAPPIA